jgi:hypothetical protein
MPGFILHVGATATCPHGGQVSEITTNIRVKVSNQFVVTATDQYPIAGCALSSAQPPSPCVLVRWTVPAGRVSVSGQPVILQTSTGLCLSPAQAPQGPPIVVTTQTRVSGT